MNTQEKIRFLAKMIRRIAETDVDFCSTQEHDILEEIEEGEK